MSALLKTKQFRVGRKMSVNIELKKGDLIMTHLGKDNNILYFRQLRRVEE